MNLLKLPALGVIKRIRNEGGIDWQPPLVRILVVVWHRRHVNHDHVRCSDIVIGVPYAGRDIDEASAMLGHLNLCDLATR